LITFKSGKLLQLKTDALDLALGAYITQEQDRQWHLIAYYLRKFLGLEKRYNVYNKELLAIVLALEH
jgi:hypothetical protein